MGMYKDEGNYLVKYGMYKLEDLRLSSGYCVEDVAYMMGIHELLYKHWEDGGTVLALLSEEYKYTFMAAVGKYEGLVEYKVKGLEDEEWLREMKLETKVKKEIEKVNARKEKIKEENYIF